MKRIFIGFLAAVAFSAATAEGPAKRILVYTHNGKGYVHDNRPASVEAIRELGRANGFAVDASDDPAVFTTENLRKYKALVFSRSTCKTRCENILSVLQAV